MASDSDQDILRQEPVASLGSWVDQLLTASSPSPPAGPDTEKSFRSAASATCIQCGIRLDGDDLVVLARPATPTQEPKIARLRMGYCARNGCNSVYYEIRLSPTPGLDWKSRLSGHPPDPATPTPPPTPGQGAPATPRTFWRDAARIALQRHGRTLAIGATLTIALLGARHWYLGGTIPFIREPEQFEVDIAPSPPHPFAHPIPANQPLPGHPPPAH